MYAYAAKNVQSLGRHQECAEPMLRLGATKDAQSQDSAQPRMRAARLARNEYCA